MAAYRRFVAYVYEYRKDKKLQSVELSRGEKDYIAALESAEQKLLKKSDQ